MSRKSIYWGILIAVVLTGLTFILGLDRKDYADTPSTVYEVYLDGKSIGIIRNEDELYNLIDKEQNSLKKKYDVNKIYAPLGLETTKLVTYTGKLDNVTEVYNKIKDAEPFTVKGYEIKIVHNENEIDTINVLKEEDFDNAIDNTVKAFVNEEQYEKYLENKQEKIVTTGSTIQDVSIKENITVKEKYLSTEDKIYTDTTELSRYLLFGTDEAQGTHIVKAGETLKDIANEYELSVKELLIVNPDLVSEQALLYAGQELNIGLINPKVSVAVQTRTVEDVEVDYKTEIKYDNTYKVGTTWVDTEGQKGISRMAYQTETINGVITQLVTEQDSTIVIQEPVTEVVVKGGFYGGNTGDITVWRWPTNSPYVITELFGWRTDPVYGGRDYHRGIDISGTGYGSPIYAANRGTITKMGYADDMGYNIWIDHGSGYQTIYMHLCEFAAGLTTDMVVDIGQVIGYMGYSGKATGTHLDFRIILNGEYLDPLGGGFNYIY